MDFAQLLKEYQVLLSILVSFAMLIIIVKIWWEEVSFYVLRVYSSLPVVGTVARLAKDVGSVDQKGWFPSEKTLCSTFLHHYQNVDKDAAFYDKCSSYLNKAQETGRNQLHFFGWLMIALMVFVEAMGFSYVLAGFTIPGASESLQQYGAIGIAFLISCLLVFLTHETGAELHKNKLIRKVRAWHDHDDGRLIPQNGVTLESDHKDDDAPAYQQLLNRVDTNANVTPGYYITAGTLAFVLLVAVGATYVRGMVLEEMLTQETMLYDGGATSAGGYTDPYSSAPQELTDISNKANNQAHEETLDSQKKGGWATFIVLAVIFVFLQVMGVLIGFFKGFAGKESKSARGYIGHFKTREQFAAYYDRKRSRVAQIAQKNLANLQQKMAKRAQSSSADGNLIKQILNHSDRSFLAYADQEAEKDSAHQLKRTEIQPVPHDSNQPVMDTQNNVQTDTLQAAHNETLEQRMARIRLENEAKRQAEERAKMESMSDKELENYMLSRGDL